VTGIYQLDVGNIIYPNSTNNALVTVTQIQPIAVIFTLPEADLPEIQQQVAKGPMTVLAYSQDNKTLLGRGKLLLVNNEINQATGTLQLKAIFPNKRTRVCRWLGTISGPCWAMLEPIPAPGLSIMLNPERPNGDRARDPRRDTELGSVRFLNEELEAQGI
jgi:hypothetical protein